MSRFADFSWSRHLYVRIYVAVLISLMVVALAFYGVVHWYPQPDPPAQYFEGVTDFATEVLPPATAPLALQQTALEHRRWRRFVGLALYDAKGMPLAAIGAVLPPPDLNQQSAGWLGGRPPVFQARLPDGRVLVGQRQPNPRHGPRNQRIHSMVWLGLIALALGIGAYPVARRITRRLERLQVSVEALGDGQLSTRVAIEGSDEVARLAASFNRSAGRIEALVDAQKALLANASHELRSPLARIRMAVELMAEQPTPAMRQEMVRNIAELDQLIDEILLASRLDGAGETVHTDERIDLTALLAEECARVDARLDAPNLSLTGNARLLRRMLRNLLENAQRYGDGTPITVSVSVSVSEPDHLCIDVCDGGRGVPPAEREKIFAPFYRLPGARERDGGVGLGLSLVRQIARAHRGDVICLDAAGTGSCFRVSLPCLA